MELLPVLNHEVLQEKATEYAMKGATESLKEYYSGYNSPFRKAIEAELNGKALSWPIQLPDVIALINDQLTKQIDVIANEAISKTFVPLVTQFLTREKAEMNFSEVLKQFIEAVSAKEIYDCHVDVSLHEKYGWYSIKIGCEDKEYELTLHEDYETSKEKVKKYSFLGLPYDRSKRPQTMKLTVEGATLEMPFTPGVLQDTFMSFIARLVIAKTKITMDCRDFDESMFPERCHCD